MASRVRGFSLPEYYDRTEAQCTSRPSVPLPDTVKNILKHDGIRGLYRGLGPTILGYLPTWAIYFAVYDGIKNRFGERPVGDLRVVGHVIPAAQVKGYQPLSRDHPWTLHLFSAMAAGATSTLCTNPLWVIKTRFMVRVACSICCYWPFMCNFRSFRLYLIVCNPLRFVSTCSYALCFPFLLIRVQPTRRGRTTHPCPDTTARRASLSAHAGCSGHNL